MLGSVPDRRRRRSTDVLVIGTLVLGGACSEAHIVDGGLDSGLDAGGIDAGGIDAPLDAPRDTGADAERDADTVDVREPIDSGPRSCDRSSALHFGTPVREASMLNVRYLTRTREAVLSTDATGRVPGGGYLSPDGLHYLAGIQDAYPCWDGDDAMGWFANVELVRRRLGDPWSAPPAILLHCLSHGGHGQLTHDYRAMFGFHGGGHVTRYQRRAAFTDRFNPWDGFQFDQTPAWRTVLPDGGAGDGWGQHFTPTPDGRLLAFESNRDPVNPGDATARTDSTTQLETFLAVAVSPSDPTMGFLEFEPLEPSPTPPAGSQTHPVWFSDDGLRLLLSSDRGGPTWDVYLASRMDASLPFGPPVPVPALSAPDGDERDVTLPSLDAIIANGCVGDGFLFRSSIGLSETMRFDVCLGAPCP
jgi:hypothetical protein